MSDGASLPAGWYDDPAGSGGHRWWAGTQWTEHVRAPEPIVPAFTPPEPLPLAGRAVQEYQPMAYTTASFPSSAPSESRYDGRVDVDNSKGWLSLGAGALSLVLLWAATFGGVVLVGTLSAVVLGITSGIRALSLRQRGMSTLLVPPVAGIALSALTVVIFFGGIVVAAASVTFDTPGIDSHQQQSFPDNPELQRMYDTADSIQLKLSDELRSGTLPTELTADATGAITLDGAVLGIIDAGQVFDYELLDGGAGYKFTLFGTVLGEMIRFNSQTGNLVVICFESDDTCGF